MPPADATTSRVCWCASARKATHGLRNGTQLNRCEIADPPRRALIFSIHELERAVLRNRLSIFAVGHNYSPIVEGRVDLGERIEGAILVRSLGHDVHRERLAAQFLLQRRIEARQQQ